MKEDVSPARFTVREWVALTPTFLKASDMPSGALDPADILAVPAGARLKAPIALQALGHSWLREPVLDGKAVPPHLSVLVTDDWELLPLKPEAAAGKVAGSAAASPTTPPALRDLSVEKLLSTRWSFGDVGIHPWSKAFYFEPNGTISGVTGPNHRFWRLEDGILTLFSQNHRPSWSSDTIQLRDGRLVVTGPGVVEPGRPKRVVLTELAPRVTQPAGPVDQSATGLAPEAVRLVIWDLDDTFWNGTLAEGGITPVPAHIEIVRQLSARGIVNSICSKNEFSRTKAALEQLGIWEYFIFPRIDFVPKGAMIKEIIEAAQLRTPSVLFIDDNMININEALHYNPGLQVCLPDAIAGLLDDPRFKGKPDPEMKRLANYKVLEAKWLDQAAAGKDNLEFLRQKRYPDQLPP